ncbi:hypothetical protein GCM10009584_06080 [Ornithinimicrobium humiphilum]|uniref:Phosphotransferase family enzyme n=1 Tax=Ornithinimicrobium humiphilum TaxID=125288 RepID=A0A543KPX4_9MICO|nr:hypothetical protein [Ornithinimicrobium humiphilum]TQM97122.1 hypothetical protein FB476_2025 [Ornithinimicrobium humiphilum]
MTDEHHPEADPGTGEAAGTAAAVPGLPVGVELGPGVDLGGSTRSEVRRHEVRRGPADWGPSVVVKRFLPQQVGSRAAMGYTRELVGLGHLPGTPRLLARHDDSRTLVMEDLGEQLPTLADALLGTDPGAAWRHCLAWAAALGATVRPDPDLLVEVRGELGEAVIEDRDARRDLPRRGLIRLHEAAGLRTTAAACSEILDAVEWLEQDTRRHVLGPGDTCPDNAVLTPGGVRFIDLEGAGVRHVAYEAAYAAEPFSTCWCVFTPPSGLTDAMLGAFTAGAARRLPDLVDDPDWPRQVRAAAAIWVLSSTLWLMDGALEDRTFGGGAGQHGPAFRALLAARWGWVERECRTELPDVAAACGEARTWALRTWGAGTSSLALPGYPAWSARDEARRAVAGGD